MFSPTSRPSERQQHYPERPYRKTQRFQTLFADAPEICGARQNQPGFARQK